MSTVVERLGLIRDADVIPKKSRVEVTGVPCKPMIKDCYSWAFVDDGDKMFKVFELRLVKEESGLVSLLLENFVKPKKFRKGWGGVWKRGEKIKWLAQFDPTLEKVPTLNLIPYDLSTFSTTDNPSFRCLAPVIPEGEDKFWGEIVCIKWKTED